jgi:hypothetical protein
MGSEFGKLIGHFKRKSRRLLMDKDIKMFVLGLILLGSLYACSLPIPHTYYVNTTGNDSNDCLSETHACQTLDAAITRATPRSQIYIGEGRFPAYATISKFLTIHGTGTATTTLYSRYASPAITVVNNVQFAMNDLEITGGFVGLEVDGVSINTQVTATRIKIDSMHTGILNSAGSAVFLNDCIIYNNHVGIITWGDRKSVV